MKFFEWQEISERYFKGTTGCGLFYFDVVIARGEARALLHLTFALLLKLLVFFVIFIEFFVTFLFKGDFISI